MKVAIAGYGQEGKVNYRYWRALGHEVTVCDERQLSMHDLPYGSRALLGEGVFEELQDFDLVVRTASLVPSKIKTNGQIWSGTREFFEKCQTPIIGVTGTKGKGTTASLIDSILRAAGKKTVLVGNIGQPALEMLEQANEADVVIYELSSFQLWDLEKSPQVAVVLMIEPDHLDVHSSFKEYVSAKANIRRYQDANGVCFYHPTNKFAHGIAMIGDHKENAKRYGVRDDGAVYEANGNFMVGDEVICSTDVLELPGRHNIENACAAISAALSYTTDATAIEKGIRDFQGLPHRLKLVAEKNGIRYYDDSIATTPGSAIAALKSFEEPKVIILGGSDKGSDYEELIKVCAEEDTQVVAIGQTGASIAKLCKKNQVKCKELGKVSMDKIVRAATDMAAPGAVVILSPASASFDMFESYADRGDKFTAEVVRL